jgi:hypothetical protein
MLPDMTDSVPEDIDRETGFPAVTPVPKVNLAVNRHPSCVREGGIAPPELPA